MSTTTQPGTGTMQLAPYVFFYGRCEEALEFYKKALGGSYELQRNSEMPPSPDFTIPEDRKNKVMHATFTAPGLSFMASDGRDDKKIDPDAGNISLSLGFNDVDQAQTVFAALSDGGDVKMPLSPAFWGGQFGMLVDRFGNEWMVVSP